MQLLAASQLGIDVAIADSPAARLTSHSVVFAHGWAEPAALDRLARMADAVTLESKFADCRVLEGTRVNNVRREHI